jgi:integrase
LAEDPPCSFVLSAATIHDLGIRDYSLGRKSPSNQSTFGPFAFGSRSHASGATFALFNLAIDSKLRACDLVKLRIDEVCSGAMVRDRATVVQKKTGRPVQFEITEQTRASLEVWLRTLRATGTRYLFPSRLHARPHLPTRQYAGWCIAGLIASVWKQSPMVPIRCGGRRSLKSIARLATFVLSSSYSAIQSWRAPSVISGLK